MKFVQNALIIQLTHFLNEKNTFSIQNKIWSFISYFLILFFISFCSCKNEVTLLMANKGVLDLRNWNFENDGMVPLIGEWEFYWNELIENSEERNKFFSNQDPTKIRYISVPSEWQNYEVNGNKLPSHGYAMYRLKVLFKKNEKPISFALTDYCLAYKLLINGVSYYQVGKVGKTAQEMEALLKYGSFTLTNNPPEEMEIVVLISNFYHPRSGMWNKITIGHVNQINAFNRNSLIVKSMNLGVLLIMSIYHIFLFYIRKKDFAPLFFGLLCAIIFIRIISMEERLIMDILPSVPFEIIYRLEYTSGFLGLSIFLCYIYSLFPAEFSKKILYFIILYNFCAMFATLLFYVEYSPLNLLFLFQIPILFSILYTSYIYILALIRKKPEAAMVIAGMIVFYSMVINDILYGIGIIRTTHMTPYGLFIFIFFQAIMLSQKFSRAFILSEIQAVELIDKTNSLTNTNLELNGLKVELEKKVEERTASLENAYHKNYVETQKIYRLEKEIAVQKERQTIFIDMHDHMGSNLSDLKKLLNTLDPRKQISKDFIDLAKFSAQKLEDNLRMKMHAIEDLQILKKDPLNGIRLLILRRYSIYDREVNFFCDSDLYEIPETNFSEKLLETLFSISQENATNDLKYGNGFSEWKFFRNKEQLCLEIMSSTSYRTNSKGTGNGKKNISLRLADLKGRVIYCESDGKFHGRFFFPLSE